MDANNEEIKQLQEQFEELEKEDKKTGFLKRRLVVGDLK